MMAIDRLSQINSTLAAKRRKYDESAGQLALLERQHTDKTVELDEANADVQCWEQVQVLLTKTSDFARLQVLQGIEDTVTAALTAVFPGEDHEFKIVMRSPGGQPAADWQVISPYGDAKVKGTPEDSDGGGITDVVSLALRLALIEMSRPKVEGPLILDEPGKWVDKERVANLAYFLKQYAAKMGRQIIMVTHIPEMVEVADKAYRVTKINGTEESVVSLIA